MTVLPKAVVAASTPVSCASRARAAASCSGRNCARHDARLAVGRQTHRPCPVELGILEGRKAQQTISQAGVQPFPGDVDLVAEHQLQGLWQLAYDGRSARLSRGRRRPRLGVILFRWQSYPQDSPPALGFPDHFLNPLSRQPMQVSEEGPLVRPGLERLVEEDAVRMLTSRLLQRKGDQVAEASLRHRVLIRKQPVVGVQTHMVSPLHGFRQHMRGEPTGERGGQRLVEEQPKMSAISGSGPLHGSGKDQPAAGFETGCCVLTRQMSADDFVGDRQESTLRALGACDPRLLADPAHPFGGAGRRVAGFAALATLEASCIHIFTAAEQRSEQVDLLLDRSLVIDA